MTEFTIGVDISKSTLDVFRLEDGALNQFANSPVGFKALIKWLGTCRSRGSCSSQQGRIIEPLKKRLAERFQWLRLIHCRRAALPKHQERVRKLTLLTRVALLRWGLHSIFGHRTRFLKMNAFSKTFMLHGPL